jgi:hypothetical protein
VIVEAMKLLNKVAPLRPDTLPPVLCNTERAIEYENAVSHPATDSE